jgi:hypothetical protein
MTDQLRIPPLRSLDMYRLAVVRGMKQCQVAAAFGLTRGRVSQVVRRVREWVDGSIGTWLFPGRDDLRFYVALEWAHIRVQESELDADTVVFDALEGSYARIRAAESLGESTPVGDDAEFAANLVEKPVDKPVDKPGANISAEPINGACKVTAPTVGLISATNPCGGSDLEASRIDELARRLAQLLIVWKKSRKLSAAFRTPAAS